MTGVEPSHATEARDHPRGYGADLRPCLGSARLREYEATLWHAASYDPRQRAALSEALRVRACLRLRPDVIDSAEQVVCLLAICQLTDLPEPVVEPFLVAYLAELHGSCAA